MLFRSSLPRSTSYGRGCEGGAARRSPRCSTREPAEMYSTAGSAHVSSQRRPAGAVGGVGGSVDSMGVPCYIGGELPVLGNTECGVNPQRSRHCDRKTTPAASGIRAEPSERSDSHCPWRGREGSAAKVIRKPGDESRDQYLRGKRMAGVCASWRADHPEPMPDSLFPIPFGCRRMD